MNAIITIIVGVSMIIVGGVSYPFWPDTAVLGPLWSSVAMAAIGLSIALIGVCWKLQECCRYDLHSHQVSPTPPHNPKPVCKVKESEMRIGTIAGGVATLLFGAVMYPFWPDSAVLGPFWSSMVMGGVGLSITVVGICLAKGRG